MIPAKQGGRLAPDIAVVAAAYDAIAPEYDQHLLADEAARRLLWQHYARLFRPGMRVLDVGCGTGIDAVFLARRGVQVVAIDVSPGMVAELRRKVRQAGLAGQVEAHVMDVAGLAAWPPASFDGIISAFAGLNTVPDLATASGTAARLLRPGGRLIVHMLNRCSAWDVLHLCQDGRFRTVKRRIQQRERMLVIGGRPVLHYLYSPEEAYRRFFAAHFRLVHAFAIGVLCPPPNVRWAPPVVAAIMRRLDRRVGGWRPLLPWGRFFLLDLDKE